MTDSLPAKGSAVTRLAERVKARDVHPTRGRTLVPQAAILSLSAPRSKQECRSLGVPHNDIEEDLFRARNGTGMIDE